MFVFDALSGFYDSLMEIVSTICFCSLIICCVYIYWAAVVGQISKPQKQAAVGALIWVCILIGIHCYLVNAFNIPLLVPPLGTPFFVQFMQVIQYLVTIAVLLLVGFIFIVIGLKMLDKRFETYLMSALMFLGVLIFLHFYILGAFGVPLIFPPAMW